MISRRDVGTVIGVLAGLACAGLASVFIVANPYGQTTADEAGLWIAIVPGIGVLGILAAIAASLHSRRMLLVVFVISFFPFSLYLAMTPGIFRWFAVIELAYIVAAILVKPT